MFKSGFTIREYLARRGLRAGGLKINYTCSRGCMPRCGKLGRDTWGFISQRIRKTVENVLNDPNYNVPRLYWETYHNFGKRVWGIMRHGGGQAEIDNVIKEYQDKYGVNPNILRIIVDRLMPILSAWLVRLHHC